ncbi:D-amino-acid dehydrogenase/Ca-activated chloride channel family protein [Laceyella sacchari]|uniref:vWA domain-containing protein n=1 Tax=Laceyella sacchari TaxID=37482 RepID=UPI00105287D3|nr:VWA domain-containing protein [Laceyella sacchari]TCW36619.1 D-amino-acid dehydrogenase/Ca-activated chloride channel family protein [Laceyella sacchari]
MKLFKAVLALLVLPVYLVACSQEEQAGAPSEEVKKKQESTLPPVPKTLEGLMRQNPGKYAGDKYNKAAVNKELDKMPKEYAKDPEKVYSYINHLLAQNYLPLYNRFLAFNPNFSVNNATPDGKIKMPKLEKINVEIVLDASGSMAGQVAGGQKMDLAKEAVRSFASSIPKEAKVSLRVYGHKGSNQPKDKQLSCQSSELVYPLNTYDQAQFESALSKFKPTGYTPLAKGIEEAHKDLADAKGEGVRNVIYVVSDGIETCGGNPVKAAQQLKDSGIKPVINIVGFDVDDAGQKQLQEVAEAGGGVYKSVYSANDLKEYLQAEKDRIKSEWEMWAIDTKLGAWSAWAKKREELEEAYGKLTDLTPPETKRLFEANDYLLQKGLINQDINTEVTKLILERQRTIEGELNDRYFEIGDVLERVEKQIKEDAEKTSDRNISDLE